MFAGRYLWWMLMSTATFLFFAVYFDYVTWGLMQISGCSGTVGRCGSMAAHMGGGLKPTGFLAVAAVVLAATVARIAYLKVNLLWALAFAVWLLASAPFFLLFRDIWAGRLTLEVIAAAAPPSVLLLAGAIAYLCFPLEECRPPDGRVAQGLKLLAALAAGQATLVSLAAIESLAGSTAWLSGSQLSGMVVRQVQLKLGLVGSLWGTLPAFSGAACLVAILAAALALQLGHPGLKRPGRARFG
ncbi:hypothetical protein HFC70_24815 [Agrobacterium sp. a22-2]|uniref:hypothetical protein n=1 Tax=Agrobacterium sp. a22-2 TaxID=2283840 RepID=UPI00144759E1|nr:hypothetical protein [Agrobacterium sp. a22-2]NKN39573.1 hypothetical protein [Agrobacterium sp. a22-2]